MLRVLMGSTALTLALGFAPYAEAQTTATTSSSQKLQTVTVTAERRTANLQKTAIAKTIRANAFDIVPSGAHACIAALIFGNAGSKLPGRQYSFTRE